MTANGMCISVWSSNVCSSDLGRLRLVMRDAQQLGVARIQISAAVLPFDDVISDDALRWRGASGPLASIASFPLDAGDQRTPFARRVELRSEERRGGKECVSTCRSRLSPLP